MQKYKFICGCEVDIIQERKNNPILHIDFESILYDLNYGKTCPMVWDMLAEGKTKGVFQLEGYLGKTWSEKLQPNSIAEMAALIALIRPATLQSVVDGKNMTQHYVDRKHGIEPNTPVHPSLAEILNDTYNILIFQEQNIKIVRELAGFTEEESETLRKATGKKDAKLMSKVRKDFIEGCKKTGKVSEEDANTIFNWIQESQRYQFNLGHSCSYGQIGYLSAFVKYHFPLQFFASYLTFSKDKLDHVTEIKELIEEAKKFNIPVLLPNLKSIKNIDICIDNKILRFGLKSMKSMGESAIDKILLVISEKESKLSKTIDTWSWQEILYNLLPNINLQNVNALITGGILDSLGYSRSQMLLEFQKVKELTKGQLEKLIQLNLPLIDGLKELEKLVNKNQKQKIKDLYTLIEKSTHSMSDRISWVISSEKDIFGVPITYNPIDVLKNGFTGNTSCKEFLEGKTGEISIAGEVENSKHFKIKNGKNAGKMMAKCQLNDGTAIIDCVLFQKNYDDYSKKIENGNLVCIFGKRSDSNSLIIDSLQEVY